MLIQLKEAFDNAIKEAEDLLHNNPGILDHNTLQNIINKIEEAQNALNGQANLTSTKRSSKRTRSFK